MTLDATDAGTPSTSVRDIAFELVDTMSGLVRLARRSPTLGGSVPVRVAQGCVPLLEGNAWGYAVTLTRRIELRRWLRGWTVTSFDDGEDLSRMVRASVPLLERDGTLRAGAWRARLDRGVVDAGRTLSLFTGLFVRPRTGARLRVATLGNRRSLAFKINEAIFDDDAALTPLVLDLVAAPGADTIVLDGEIASLGVLSARTTFSHVSLAEGSEVANRHVAFYSGEYFATKKRGTVARSYRDDVVRSSRASDRETTARAGHGVDVRVVDGGPSLLQAVPPARFHRPGGTINAPSGTPPDRLVLKNAISFTATYDGYTLSIDYDRDALDEYAARVRAHWRSWLDATGAAAHEGALLYLTKYFTPHPPGEPHFFVKPASLVATSPGSSTLIDGLPGGGYDVMRGVIRSDSFHAAPAVFHLWRPGDTITVARGAPLANLFAFSRALDGTDFEAASAGAGGAWA